MSDQKVILKEWLKDKLSNILKFEIEDDMADTFVNMKTDEEVETYLKALLDFKDYRTRKFAYEFIKRRQTLNCLPTAKKKTDALDEKYRVNSRKGRVINENMVVFDQKGKKPESQSQDDGHHKTKSKFVNFTSKNGETVLLKGRYCCNCEAKKHALINNCLVCGRIVCEQEGSGPCYVCGTLVCTPEEQAAFNGDTSKASKLYEQLLTKDKPKGLEEAEKQRDKLLDYDRNSQRHTHVFDDDSDYFCSSNPWLTIQERDDMKKREAEFFSKKHESRRTKKVTLNLKDQTFVEEKENRKSNQMSNSIEYESGSASNAKFDYNDESVDRLIDPFFPLFNMKFKTRIKRETSHQPNTLTSLSHIMDTEIHQMMDEGYCLSVHQPWASFLVHGIRKVEGRTWYTPYRGKLWIASTGAKISRPDCEKYENTYRMIRGDDIKFPADYPPGCLLGCVDLVDCLTQEQYRSEFPDGESEDPYVFICENPQVLPVRYPIKGQRNIYKLDDKIHKAARTCIRMTEKVMSESEHKVKSLRP